MTKTCGAAKGFLAAVQRSVARRLFFLQSGLSRGIDLEEMIQMFRDWIEQGVIECCPKVDVHSHTWSQVKNKYKE